MRYSIFIDQVHSVKWGLNGSQAALFSILIDLPKWAKEIFIDGKMYYHASRNMIINEIPLHYSKPDTVYKALTKLKELELIEYVKFGVKDLIRISEKGKDWNNADSSEHSDLNLSKLGFKSESNSDLNPTYKSTILDQLTSKSIYDDFRDKFNQATGRNIRVFDAKAKRQFNARIKEGFSADEILKASENCSLDKYHLENPKYLTIEFITRSDKLQMYLNSTSQQKKTAKVRSNNLEEFNWDNQTNRNER